MTSRAATFGSLWRRLVALAALAPSYAAAWLLVLTGLGVAADLTWRQEGLSSLLNLVAACSVTTGQYSVSRVLIRKALPLGPQLAGFGTFFVLYVAAGLGTLVGLLLLIIPGIILMIRWSVCVPAMFAQDLDVGESLRFSWRQTAGHELPILLLLLSIWLPALLIGGLGAAMAPGAPTLPGSLLLNLAANSAIIGGWYAAVAIYLCTDFSSGVEEVFA